MNLSNCKKLFSFQSNLSFLPPIKVILILVYQKASLDLLISYKSLILTLGLAPTHCFYQSLKTITNHSPSSLPNKKKLSLLEKYEFAMFFSFFITKPNQISK